MLAPASGCKRFCLRLLLGASAFACACFWAQALLLAPAPGRASRADGTHTSHNKTSPFVVCVRHLMSTWSVLPFNRQASNQTTDRSVMEPKLPDDHFQNIASGVFNKASGPEPARTLVYTDRPGSTIKPRGVHDGQTVCFKKRPVYSISRVHRSGPRPGCSRKGDPEPTYRVAPKHQLEKDGSPHGAAADRDSNLRGDDVGEFLEGRTF